VSTWGWIGAGLAVALAVYVGFVLALFVLGRKTDARAWARFVPDCVVLFTRLMRDERVPRRHKLLIGALVLYLAMPIDLVPDFIPVVGVLDDAIIVALVLRTVFRSAGSQVLGEHWPGPPQSLDLVLRLAGKNAT
jgi:uncharacterized membrane protein YkvA (DUF1232 family)